MVSQPSSSFRLSLIITTISKTPAHRLLPSPLLAITIFLSSLPSAATSPSQDALHCPALHPLTPAKSSGALLMAAQGVVAPPSPPRDTDHTEA
ncbi:hypothetical protein E2C01_033463 [Portunus trituberculatus]|uniref:Uncharacterized protein n=1 Tax=Portunus trituberculatus TaxID=210409 RepID=A0A5B7EXY0_PORTR|nr:hypothetical protein [Portunus trituberculatus]